MLTRKPTVKVHPTDPSSMNKDHFILHDEEERIIINENIDSLKQDKQINGEDKISIEVKNEHQKKNKCSNKTEINSLFLSKEDAKVECSNPEQAEMKVECTGKDEIKEQKDMKGKSIEKEEIKAANVEDQGLDIVEEVRMTKELTSVNIYEIELKELYATDIALILDKNNKNILFQSPEEIIDFATILKMIKDNSKNENKKHIVNHNSSNSLEIVDKEDLNNKRDDYYIEEIKKEVKTIIENTEYKINDHAIREILGDSQLNSNSNDEELNGVKPKYNSHTALNIARLLSNHFSLNELKVLRQNIFKQEHPNMPLLTQKICLWIRLKTNATQQYFFKRTVKKWVPNVINLITCGIEINNIVNDISLLWIIYQFSLRYQNQYTDYIFLYTAKLVCICIPYIIAYANGNQILIAKKTFYPKIFTEKPWYLKLLIGLYLTFLGPLYFVFLKIVVPIMVLLKFLILPLPIQIYHAYDKKIEALIFKIGLEKSEYDGLLQQMAACQLIFQNLPLVILDILLVSNVLRAPGILDESSTLVYTALASTLANIIIQFIQLKIQANYFQEGFFDYTFNTMKAKLKWVPFLHKIEKDELTDMVLDYGYIRCPFWIFSSWFGYYIESQYQFNEVSMIRFSEVINNLRELKEESSQDFYSQEIMISNSIDGLTLPCLGMLLRGLILKYSSDKDTIITDFDQIDWNSKLNILKPLTPENAVPKEKVELRTHYGDSILHLIVESELLSGSMKFSFRPLMDCIIENQSFINLDIKDYNGITPLQLALMSNKRHTACVLLKAGSYNFITPEGDNIFHILLKVKIKYWKHYMYCCESLMKYENLKNAKNKKGQTPLVSVLENNKFSSNRLYALGITIPLNDLSTVIALKQFLDYIKLDSGNRDGVNILNFINVQEKNKFATVEELSNYLSGAIITLKNVDSQDIRQNGPIDSHNLLKNHQIIIKDHATPINTHQNKLYAILSFSLESLAMIDLITDILVVIQLASNGHTSWTSLSVLTFLAPYYTCYSPLVACFIERNTFSKARGLLGWILITPFNILYFILLDLIYIISEFLFSILAILTFGLIRKVINMENILNLFFEYTFRLDRMDVRGIRQLRTITQLIFESIPQLILQARILGYGGQLNMDVTSIIISLVAALLHLLLEASIIRMESKACKTTFIYYSSLCLASRLNWVPFIERYDEFYRNLHLNEPLDYENMKYEMCCFSHVVEYEFNNSTLEILKREIAKLPRREKVENWLNILLCPIKNANLKQIFDFLILTNKRAIIKRINYTEDYEGMDLIGKADCLQINCMNLNDEINDYILNDIIHMISSRKNTMKKIDLNFQHCNKITMEGMIGLSESISHLEELKELTLNMAVSTLISEELMAKFTVNLSKLIYISKLNLNFENCKITDQIMQYVSNMLKKFKMISCLSLNFEGCKEIADKGLESLAESIKNLETLQLLKLKLNNLEAIQGEGVIILASNIRNLTSITELNIEMRNCPKISKEGLNALADAIGNLKTLTNLSLHNYYEFNYDDEIAKQFADNILLLDRISKLELNISENPITNKSIMHFGQILMNIHTIDSLDLNFQKCNAITDEGFQKLVLSIQEMSNIKILKFNISENITAFPSLSNILLKKSMLSELFLNLDSIIIDDSGIIEFASKIKNCLSLETFSLILGGCEKITNKGLKSLADAIKCLSRLTYLNIKNEGLKSLSEAIKYLTALEYLYLNLRGWSMIDHEGSKILYDALANHKSLISLELELDDKAKMHSLETIIENVLRKNRSNHQKN